MAAEGFLASIPAAGDPLSGDARRRRRVDAALSILLVIQGLTLFVATPLVHANPLGFLILDACRLAFALVCVGVLARHPMVQAAIVAAIAALVLGPPLGARLGPHFHIAAAVQHEIVAAVAFAFNAGVTVLVGRHVFGPGRVTAHRIRGAVLVYLNVAALFAIAYGILAMAAPGAFIWASGASAVDQAPTGSAAFSYFSLTTMTTTGYGDIIPVHPLARSLANLEAVFGQLFPATLLSRLVSLHLVHEREGA